MWSFVIEYINAKWFSSCMYMLGFAIACFIVISLYSFARLSEIDHFDFRNQQPVRTFGSLALWLFSAVFYAELKSDFKIISHCIKRYFHCQFKFDATVLQTFKTNFDMINEGCWNSGGFGLQRFGSQFQVYL